MEYPNLLLPILFNIIHLRPGSALYFKTLIKYDFISSFVFFILLFKFLFKKTIKNKLYNYFRKKLYNYFFFDEV